jgi:SpoVK/Ycf46/Vps4 family AAA+-type ATPase
LSRQQINGQERKGKDLTNLCAEAWEKAQESAGEEGTPLLTINSFHATFDKVRPSVNPDVIQQLEEWCRVNCMDGSFFED